MLIRDRIRELRRIQASQLRPNAKNWRTHPPEQQDALRGILAEVGYADALVARELPDGTFELIDGHLRAETTPDQLVPVLLLDVTDAEANKLLVSLDPLASLAEADAAKLHALIAEIDTDSEALNKMLADLEIDNPLDDDEEPPAAEPAPPPPERGTHWDIRHGDVLEVLRTLPAESVHCVVTSPPYWGLRDYGTGTWEGGDPECDHKRPDGQGKPRPELPTLHRVGQNVMRPFTRLGITVRAAPAASTSSWAWSRRPRSTWPRWSMCSAMCGACCVRMGRAG